MDRDGDRVSCELGMAIEITAALLGDPRAPRGYPGQLHDEEWARPYAQRPKAHLTVDETDTLQDACRQAVTHFESLFPEGDFRDANIFFAFYLSEDESGMSSRWWRRISTVVTLVDLDGRALWNRSAGSATYASLLEAAEAGALLGDPRRPYVVLNPPMGDGFLGSWQDVVNAWGVFWELVKAASIVGGAIGLPASLEWFFRKRSGGLGPEELAAVCGAHASSWAERWGKPPDVGATIEQPDRRSATELARLLGCDVPEAEVLLVGRGFVRDEASGLWVPGQDEASVLLRRAAGSIDWSNSSEPDDLNDRLRKAIRGEDPWS